MHKLIYHALEKVNMGIIIIDKEHKILIWNGWLERYTGKSKDETIGKNLSDVYQHFAEKNHQNILNSAILFGQSRFCSSTLHKIFVFPADETRKNVQQNMQVEPIFNDNERFALIQIMDITGHHHRVSQLKNAIREIGLENEQIKVAETMSRYQAMHDSLTGLPNRVLFRDRLEAAIISARRNNQKLAVMFMDLDGFKAVNDNFGHAVGDLLLKEVVERLKHNIRESDTLARLGGDEFMLILFQIAGQEDAANVARKLLESFNQVFRLNEHNVSVTASVGISIYPNNSENTDTLTKQADSAMYKAKAAGKNTFRFYDDSY